MDVSKGLDDEARREEGHVWWRSKEHVVGKGEKGNPMQGY